jgi:hypothetical protein
MTRNWAAALSIWIVYWIIYDGLRVVPNWQVSAVHIKDLYDFDKKWFGIGGQTLNEWLASRTSTTLDVLSAIFYFSWIPMPMMFAAWLYFKNKNLYFRFSACFVFVNIIGFAIYYIFPAAPPWYILEHGFEFKTNVMRSAAGLDRVDKLFGIHFFERLYTRNSNVFAAMPSLHSAFPFVSFLYARAGGFRGWKVAFLVFAFGIWLSAIYTYHHFVADVMVGILVAGAGYFVFEKWINRGFLGRFFDKFSEK